jgi:hypothetical protein
MAGTATGVTLAAIAAREGVSKQEAEEMMDQLVDEGALKKQQKDGEIVYVATGTAPTPAPAQPAQSPAPPSAAGSTKFCRECGAKIPLSSKFCESCGARLDS